MRSVPLGPGLSVRHVRLARRDVQLLGAILAGEDHLASIHGDPDRGPDAEGTAMVVVAVLTTDARAGELDRWLAALASELGLTPVESSLFRA